jgi:hypothetical protein
MHVVDIRTTDSRLAVRVRILDDTFHIAANEALLILDLAGYPRGHDDEWTADCVSVLDRLLSDDLRVRVRERFAGSAAGAIWVPDPAGGGAWNGEAGAVDGRGTVTAFPNWYLKLQGRSGSVETP